MRDLVESVMTTRVVTVKAEEPLAATLKKMVARNIGSVIVVDAKGRPRGIITERDVLRYLRKGAKALTMPVGKLMSSPLISASPNTSNQEAIAAMFKHGIRRLPVMKKEKLVGIVTERDLLKWVLQVSYEPNVPPESKL